MAPDHKTNNQGVDYTTSGIDYTIIKEELAIKTAKEYNESSTGLFSRVEKMLLGDPTITGLLLQIKEQSSYYSITSSAMFPLFTLTYYIVKQLEEQVETSINTIALNSGTIINDIIENELKKKKDEEVVNYVLKRMNPLLQNISIGITTTKADFKLTYLIIRLYETILYNGLFFEARPSMFIRDSE